MSSPKTFQQDMAEIAHCRELAIKAFGRGDWAGAAEILRCVMSRVATVVRDLTSTAKFISAPSQSGAIEQMEMALVELKRATADDEKGVVR